MSDVGSRCTDGYRYGTVIEQHGTIIRVRWDFGNPETDIRPRDTIRVVEKEAVE